MKKGTKRIVIHTLNEEVRRLKQAIDSCRGFYPVEHPHVMRLNKKVDNLQKAIAEVEAC